MPPSNRWHSLIVGNLIGEIGNPIKDSPYQILAINMRILIRSTGLFAYPDRVVLGDRPKFLDRTEETLLNPCILIEVMSPATEDWDRGGKFAHYRGLASLTDYVLASQDKVRVEHYSRQGDEWPMVVASRLDESLRLGSIACDVPLGEIYEKVFPKAEARPAGCCDLIPSGESP